MIPIFSISLRKVNLGVDEGMENFPNRSPGTTSSRSSSSEGFGITGQTNNDHSHSCGLSHSTASVIDRSSIIAHCKMDDEGVFFQFSLLPPELCARILSFVNSYAELRSLCLVSKAISKEAFPLLYETVKVPYNETKASNWFKLMKTENSLARAVKALNVDLAVLFSVESRQEGIEILVTDVLRSLINLKESVLFFLFRYNFL
jgi:hypothetical protein